jgi:hypothetical protein
MMGKYILDGHKPVLEPDVLKWAQWFEKAERHVAWDLLESMVEGPHAGEEVQVSTVFLGIDYSFSGGTPILFETMIFGGPMDEDQDRYHTWEEAENGHQRLLFLHERVHGLKVKQSLLADRPAIVEPGGTSS